MSGARSAGNPAAKSVAEFYEEGIDLFNQGRFFECHEAWEEAWKRSVGAEKIFYQGIIQAAVAILHVQRGNLDGAAKLRAKALAKIDPLPVEHMGVALGELRDQLAAFFDAAFARKQSPLAPLPKLSRLPRR
jgi:predicted metal-dependent hydrolase